MTKYPCKHGVTRFCRVCEDSIVVTNMTDEQVTRELEKVVTIDGRGRPAKARLLVTLMEQVPEDKLVTLLKEIGKRKFF